MLYMPSVLAAWARLAWENGKNVSAVSCLPFSGKMAYTTFLGLKSSGSTRPRGRAATAEANCLRATADAIRVSAEMSPWKNRWLNGADPAARLT